MRWRGTRRGGMVQRFRAMARNKARWDGTAIQGDTIAARRARARISFKKKPDHGPCLDWAAVAKLRTACVDAGLLSFVNGASFHCANPFHSSAAGRSRWVTVACREKNSVKLWSNSAEHECLLEVLQVARWLKCGPLHRRLPTSGPRRC